MTFNKGDILLPRQRTNDPQKLRHPAVVWTDGVDGNMIFSGVMLTKSPPRGGYDNVKMNPEHFCEGFKISCNNSHFVNQIFEKSPAWGPFEKVGQLTAEGIRFIEEKISYDNPQSFDEYIKKWNNESS